MGADAVDHYLGSIQSLLVGTCGIKVGAGAEKEAGEGDEYKCDNYAPTSGIMEVESRQALYFAKYENDGEADEENDSAIPKDVKKR